jgi:hypothetical protein
MIHARPYAPARAAMLVCAAAVALCAVLLGAPTFALARGGKRAAHTRTFRKACSSRRRRGGARRQAGRHSCPSTAKRTSGRGGPAKGGHAPRLEATPIGSPEGGGTSGAGSPPPPSGAGAGEGVLSASYSGVTTDPIDPHYLTEVPFGTSSFWIQPWRAYLDTWPASRLLESVGVNFNAPQRTFESNAQILQDSGFKFARIGINWYSLSYSEPNVFWNEAEKRARLQALVRHGLRPLILLDAPSGAPAPSRNVTLTTTVEAPLGATTVQLSPESAALVVPGKTGFNCLSFCGNPDILITAVDANGVATLSKPLPQALAAGGHAGRTLLYAPFQKPTLPNGAPNPVFEETLAGWIHYVAEVTKLAASVAGPGGYDLEIWNELTWGSQFLNSEHYYTLGSSSEEECLEEPLPEIGTTGECEQRLLKEKESVNKEIRTALMNATIAYVRNPENGIGPEVGITDGFASQTPFPSGASAPIGLTALSKHPYATLKEFPSYYTVNGIRPINALGLGDRQSRTNPAPQFIPSFTSLFPEFRLSALATETLVRDVAPFVTEIYGNPHGRTVGPEGGEPLQKWITEYNLGFKKTTLPVGPDGVTPQLTVVSPADKVHFEAKALLRSLVATVGKGIQRDYFYAATKAGPLSMISESFEAAAEADPSSYPGDSLGGEVMDGFRNMLAQFAGPGPGAGGARQLQLLSIAQYGNHAQFRGDGTAAHPPLYDREVLGVFPFQSAPGKFEIPVYVMTRDLLTLYQPLALPTEIHRFDLPDEHFRITLGNLPKGGVPTITAYDPLRNERTPAHLVSQEGSTATIEIAATDYPRILTVQYPGS